ncbi:MAG: (Fe-S)-binding protein [Deltaproteobacteria bacterium]|nr:MAG: (Fe-S)-binding protein [Deltaproteobacteria bacterium]
MYTLQFDEQVCVTCPTTDCLTKCQYMELDPEKAHDEMMNLLAGKDSLVLNECMTCYACEEYCRRGNHPYYLICERREEKGILTAPRPITNQWINMTAMQGKFMVGEIKDMAMSCCFIPQLCDLGKGVIFRDVTSASVFGAEFMCPAVHTHFAKMSVVKERLPQVMDNFKKLGVKQVLCMHDECYGTFTSIAPAYGIEVPFEPIYYMDYLLQRLQDLKDQIRPLNIKAVYQRPCSNRLIPHKFHLVKEILDLIGVELLERKYQGDNALCCGGGGGNFFTDILGSGEDSAGRIRIREALDTGAEMVAVACPNCAQMLLDAAKIESAGEKIKIADVAEIFSMCWS